MHNSTFKFFWYVGFFGSFIQIGCHWVWLRSTSKFIRPPLVTGTGWVRPGWPALCAGNLLPGVWVITDCGNVIQTWLAVTWPDLTTKIIFLQTILSNIDIIKINLATVHNFSSLSIKNLTWHILFIPYKQAYLWNLFTWDRACSCVSLSHQDLWVLLREQV